MIVFSFESEKRIAERACNVMLYRVHDNTLPMPKFLGRENVLIHFHPVFNHCSSYFYDRQSHVIKEQAFLTAINSSTSKGGSKVNFS